MPDVIATPRSLRNGEVITEFTDTTSTTAVTYTYPLQQAGISIENSGVADIFVTVGSYTNQLVQSDEKWKADVVFTSFSIRSDANSQEFTATAFQNDIEGSGEADSVARGMINALKAETIRGKDGKRYKIVGGALRNTGGVWAFIADAVHDPINVSSVISDASTITMNFGFTAKSIGVMVCTPDEAYVRQGIHFGASVGTSYAVITPRIFKQLGGYIFYNGTSWDISNAPGVTSAVWSTDKMVITHENMFQTAPDCYNVQVSTRGGALIAQPNGVGATTADIEFFDYAGTKITAPNTNMKIYFTRLAAGNIAPSVLNVASSNIWVLGIFEV